MTSIEAPTAPGCYPTVNKFAQITETSRSTVLRGIKDGSVPIVRLGPRSIRVDLLTWQKQQGVR